jgi:hypothetical protein
VTTNSEQSERANEVRSALARSEYEVRQELTSEAWNYKENNNLEHIMSEANICDSLLFGVVMTAERSNDIY